MNSEQFVAEKLGKFYFPLPCGEDDRGINTLNRHRVETRKFLANLKTKPVAKHDIYVQVSFPTEVQKNASLEQMLKAVSAATGISVDAMKSPTRVKKVVRARSIFIRLARRRGIASYPKIGRLLDRDHTTVINADQNIINKPGLYEPEFSKLAAVFL